MTLLAEQEVTKEYVFSMPPPPTVVVVVLFISPFFPPARLQGTCAAARVTIAINTETPYNLSTGTESERIGIAGRSKGFPKPSPKYYNKTSSARTRTDLRGPRSVHVFRRV